MSVPQASATEKASLFKAGVKNPQRPLKTAEIDIIQAKADSTGPAQVSTWWINF